MHTHHPEEHRRLPALVCAVAAAAALLLALPAAAAASGRKPRSAVPLLPVLTARPGHAHASRSPTATRRSAGGSLGAGVGASPIALPKPAEPGHAYALPSLYVVNTGTLRSLYHVRVERLSPGSASVLPAGWVTIERNDFQLAGHQSAIVPIRITIPAKAKAGDYLSDLVASTTSPSRGGGTALGAAAATKLQLSIKSDTSPLPWKTITLILAGLLGLLGGSWIVVRSGIRLRLEHA
jgi:hypothetical protein